MPCCVPNCFNASRLTMDRSISLHNFPHPIKESVRFDQWITALNTQKLLKKSPMSVYQQFRVCRKHFEKHHFNGICKRLLKNAVPSLYLNGDTNVNRKPAKSLPIVTKRRYSLNVKSGAVDEDELLEEEQPYYTQYEVIENAEDTAVDENLVSDHELILNDDTEDETNESDLSNDLYDIIDENDADEINLHNSNHINHESSQADSYSNVDVRDDIDGHDQDIDMDDPNEMFDIIDIVEDYNKVPLSEENFKQWRKDFYNDPKNILAQNICSRVDPFEVCLSRKALEKTQHVFNYKVETEGKPLTNQKSSGRCWIFAALNVIRIPFAKEMKLEEFEFSQSYLFYWDKIERCHYFLNNIVETSHRGEEVDGRLISFLLQDPTCDGGQWDMICNLINKHGLMPKKCFPESFSCESSHNMNAILKSKLREYARILHEMVQASKDEDDIKKMIQKQMTEVYNIVGICLGIPPETFTWEYYSDKSKDYKRIGPISAIEFYEKLVKPEFDVNNKVCIVTDPRLTSSYGKAYTVDCLGNVVGGRPVLYNNQPVEVLLNLVKESLQKGQPVWFGCEVSKRFAGKLGIEDLEIHDFKIVFNVDIQITMSKADRLRYGESAMTHAMSFTAVAVDDKDKAIKFRVENSWGEDRGEKGYLIMSADWFKEFVFEIVVDKSLVPSSIMQVFEMTPIVLPAWDPMGTLAKNYVE